MSLMDVAARRANDGGLDKPVAALAALAAAAMLFLIPAGIIENLMVESGLASMFPPLDPPLGMKARAGLALVAAGFTFGFVMTLMKLIGGATARRRAPEPVDEMPSAPRVRRRDSHPDAPARAPFSVARDMDVFEEPVEAEPVVEGALPPMPKPKPKPAPEPIVQTQGPRRRAPLTAILAGEVDPEPEPAPIAEPQVDPETTAAERLRKIKLGRDEEPADEPAPIPAEEELVLVRGEEPVEPQEEAAPPSWMEPEPAAPEQVYHERLLPNGRRAEDRRGNETLPELLARLELAMQRRAISTAVTEAEPEPVEDEAMDTRLRSALENLKRFAPRAG